MGDMYSGNSVYRIPWKYHNIREGGERMSDKVTADGLRAAVHQQEFGWRQTANAFSYFFFFVFSGMKMKVHLQQIYII
jgi:hypothetical protein